VSSSIFSGFLKKSKPQSRREHVSAGESLSYASQSEMMIQDDLRDISPIRIDPDLETIEQLELDVNNKETEIKKLQDTTTAEVSKLQRELEDLDGKKEKINQEIQLAISATVVAQDQGEGLSTELIDYTKVPGTLDSKFEKLDEDSALGATIVSASDTWTKKYQKGLLSPQEEQTVLTPEQVQEKNKAFDLLDALTKSGALPVFDGALHVVLAATHSFDKVIMDTLVQDNVNPIEKVERSTLIVATTIHGKSVEELVVESEYERVKTYSPLVCEQK